MSQFLETICILNGVPRHLEWHQYRVDATLMHTGNSNAFRLDLTEILHSCPLPAEGKLRCRLLYDAHTVSVEFIPYVITPIRSLACIEAPTGFDYRYKYANREVLESLFALRNEADDILITRAGWITDTSIANIAFRKAERWYTPSIPLLAGTTWKRLVAKGILLPRPIHQMDVHSFESFKIFNAMNDWEESEEIPLDRNIFTTR